MPFCAKAQNVGLIRIQTEQKINKGVNWYIISRKHCNKDPSLIGLLTSVDNKQESLSTTKNSVTYGNLLVYE